MSKPFNPMYHLDLVNESQSMRFTLIPKTSMFQEEKMR